MVPSRFGSTHDAAVIPVSEPAFGKVLRSFVESVGESVDDDSVRLLDQYFTLLMRWGAVQNLTRHLDVESAARESFGDSWLGLAALERVVGRGSEWPGPVLDVGSGAGFPGLVAAIRWRASPITLVEPLKKRCSFLEEVALQLGLHNVTVRAARVESVTEEFALLLSRATVGVGRGYDALAPRVAAGGCLGLFVGPSMGLDAWSAEVHRLGLGGAGRVPYRGAEDHRAVVYAFRTGAG